MIKRLLLLLFFLFAAIKLSAAETILEWPREIERDNYIITIYQPQLETYEKNILEGRMAISIKQGEEMFFCSAWFSTTLATDLDTRIATLEDVEITKIHFPDIEDPAKIDALSDFLEAQIRSWNVTMSIDRLSASLADIDNLKTEEPTLDNSPPVIYFRTDPTVLITIDGDPIVKKLDNTDIEYVVNTPFFIVKNSGSKTYFLNGRGDIWYSSDAITGDWKQTKEVPNNIKQLAKEQASGESEDNDEFAGKETPQPLVVTEPSELVQTDGKPQYQSVQGSSLLYVKNTESDILMNVDTQEHFILLAGRWYRSKTLADGDWQFVEPKDVPKEFANIPEKSDMASVRPSVPDTPEAQDALLDQLIPQTAAVDRKTTTVKVSYDGQPKFTRIEGTDVAFAENADKTVLQIRNDYYCVDDGIWFIASHPEGPWQVSDVRPDEVDTIPPSSPVYNVKYVYVYDSTPDVVHVGYYPGYSHSYVYNGVVVYGTGYWYRPWYRYHYYPRPCTFGFGVHWNSYTGWGFSFGFSYGWVGWRFHPYPSLYWGPRGYRHGYRHGYSHGFVDGIRAGYRLGDHDFRRPVHYNNRVNIYNNRKTGIIRTNTNRRTDVKAASAQMRASKKANNLFADKNGNIYQRSKDGKWSERTNRPEKRDLDRSAKQVRQQQPASTKENIANRPKVQQKQISDTWPNRVQKSQPQQRATQQREVKREIPQQQLNRSHQNRVKGENRMQRSRPSSGDRARGGDRRR